MNNKAEEIRRVLSEPVVDLWKLRELALSEGGLVNDSLRKLAWPKLVGVDAQCHQFVNSGSSNGNNNGNDGSNHVINAVSPTSVASLSVSTATTAVPNSLDHEQIDRDVSRVTWHLLTGNQRSRNFQMKNKHRKRIAQLLKKKQRRLGDYLNLILVLSYHQNDLDEDDMDYESITNNAVKIEHDGIIANSLGSEDGDDELNTRLRYYQGFHDVGSIVLSALGGASPSSGTILPPAGEEGSTTTNEIAAYNTAASSMGLDLACQVLLRLSRSHMRDAMRANFLTLQSALKLIVMPLTAAFDSELHSHLMDCEMEPYFCLSWVITWFSHDVRDTALVKRLFDFFIVSHPMMSVYLSVAMMIHPLNRIEILGTDCDFACVHNALADLPKNSSNVGWKYLPGEQQGSSGYVTGEDTDDASIDPSLQDQSIDDGDEGSVVSMLGSQNRARVPFQELIDLSISLMHKIPPRNLINLAQRYHTEITLQPLMAQSSTIALLQPPPSWALATHTDSDWVIRQKMRDECLLPQKLNRHQRKVRLKQQMGGSSHGGSTTEYVLSTDPTSASTHPLLEKPSLRAIIASGTGPDGRAEARKLRKRRLMIGRSVFVVVIAVLIALAKSYFSSQSSLPSTSPPKTASQLTKDVLKEENVAQMLLSDDSEDASSLDSGSSLADEVVFDGEDVADSHEEELSDKAEVGQSVEESCESPAALSSIEEGENKLPGANAVYAEAGESAAREYSINKEKSAPPTTTTKQQTTSTSSAAKEATLQVLMRSSVLFVKNLTTINNNQTLDLQLDQLERHFDFLMMQLMETAKATWFKVAPVLLNALQIGWRQIKMGWLKIAPVVKKELSVESDGENLEWADDAMKTWKKQEKLLKHQGKLIHSVTKSVISDVRKLAKKAKEGLKNNAD